MRPSQLSPSVMRVLMRWLVVAAVCVSLGLQWAVLQGVAWTNMLITYSRDASSLMEAVTKTFDGDHPCALCLAVEKGQQQDQQQQQAQPTSKKFDAVLVQLAVIVPPGAETLPATALDEQAQSRPAPPPWTPPRQA